MPSFCKLVDVSDTTLLLAILLGQGVKGREWEGDYSHFMDLRDFAREIADSLRSENP